MIMVLGKDWANFRRPNPQRVRDRNSPAAPAMCRHQSHDGRFRSRRRCRQHRWPALAASSRLLRIEARGSSVVKAEGCGNEGWAAVKKPIVVNETEARQATKERVVRYILLASLILVVVLFIVAYLFFH
jgi:hypothetical protein